MIADSSEQEPEDLSSVLENIGWGKLAATRARLANTPATRDFLEIGLSLLRDDLLGHTGPDFDRGQRSRLFESLSRERIVERAAELDQDNSKLLTVNVFRDRWDRKGRYTEDLISYLFRLGPQQRHLQDMAEAAMAMLAKASFKELVQQLAAVEVAWTFTDPLSSLQVLVQVSLPSHPKVRHFVQAQYNLLLPGWADLYERVAAAYGLKLKPGITWLDMALLFNTVTEGALLRGRIDRAEPTLSNGEGVLAGAILTMVPSLVEAPSTDYANLRAIGF
jgi:hypothetical protein